MNERSTLRHALLVILLTCFAGGSLYAQCGGTYTSTYDPSTAQVTYQLSASGACGVTSIQISNLFWLPGQLNSYNNGTPTLSVSESHDTACLADGTYTINAQAFCGVMNGTQCQGTGEPVQVGVAGFSVNNTPAVSLSISPRAGSTVYDGTMTYSFPNTSGGSFSQRYLELRHTDPLGQTSTIWRNDSPATHNLPAQTGSISFTFDTSCWLEGPHQLMPFANHACAQSSKTGSPLTLSIQRTPVLTPTVTKNADGSNHVSIDYQFFDPSAPRQITLTLLPTPSDPSSQVESYTGLAMQGTITSNLAVAGQRLLRISALNGSCYLAEKTLGLNGNCCAAGAGGANGGGGGTGFTGDPVRIWDGAVTYTEADPLPDDLGLVFRRTYQSDARQPHAFGPGWLSVFDGGVVVADTTQHKSVAVYTESGEHTLFDQSAAGVWTQTWPTGAIAHSTLTGSEASGYSYREAGSSILRLYGGAGSHRLVALADLRSSRRITITYDASGFPTAVADSFGAWACTVTTDASHRVTRIAVNGRSDLVWNYVYDTPGNLTSVSAAGVSAPWRTYGYAQAGSAWVLASVSDALGNLLEQHAYDANGRAVTSFGPSGDITNIQYGSATTVTRADNSTSTYAQIFLDRDLTSQLTGGCATCGGHDFTTAYDALGRTWRVQDGRGYITESLYDAQNLISETRALRPSGCDPSTDPAHCALTPSALAAAALVATPATRTTTYVYGDANWPERPTAVTRPGVMIPGQTVVESFTYDAATGQTLTHTLTGSTGPAAQQESHTTATALYNGTEGAPFNPGGTFDPAWLSLPQPRGMVRSVRGPRTDVDDTMLYLYYPIDNSVPAASRGRLAAIKNALGHVTRYENYDVFGHAQSMTDPNGVVMAFTYDVLGRVLTSTLRAVPGCDTAVDPLCSSDLVSTTAYANGVGPLASTIQPNGATTAFTYDSRGRIAAYGRGTTEQILTSYDAATQKKSSESYQALENGTWIEKRRESFTYDAYGRLARITHADNSSIGYSYDAADDLTGVQDERHTSTNTRYEYDAARRLTTVTQTLGNGTVVTRYGYDAVDDLTSVTDPNGNVTSYVYDDFGRVLSQSSPVTGTTTYAYDPAGNLTSTTDANGATTTRMYDVLGRVTSASPVRPPRDPETPTTWTYDDTASAPFGRGRLTSMAEPSGAAVYRYDRRGLLASELKTIGAQTFTTSFQYDAVGNRSSMRYPSGRTVTWTFDFAGRPVTAAAGSTTLVSSASYLPFGPATEIVFGNGASRQMSYDMRYRLQSNALNVGGSTIASYQYHYDDAGNITGIDDQIDPSFSRSFGYDDLNRLTTANTGEALWGSGSYTYDAMGNTLALSLRRAANFFYAGTTARLTSANGRDVVYDAAGNEQRVGTDGMAYTALNQLARRNDVSYTYDGRGVRTITSRPVRIVSVSIVPSTVSGGASAQGTVTLSSPAPAAGAVVALASSNPAASVPASVTVAAGQTAATFSVGTVPVSGAVNAVITATFNGSSASGTLTIAGSRIDSLQMTPESVVGGMEATGNITLAAPAPEEGLAIALRSSDPAVRVPSEMSIRGGATAASFAISTTPVTRTTIATISVLVDEERRDTTLTITPPSIATLDVSSRRVRGGSGVTGTIALNGTAPESGLTVALASDSRLLSVPSSAIVAAGERSATFTVQTTPVESEATASISATSGERSVTTELAIEPPVLTGFSVAPATAVGGDAVKATPVIDGPAAASGAAVTLSSSDPSLVAAPPAVTIPPGAASESVQLPTNPVSAATPVVISASRQGVTHSTTVTLEPPPTTLASLAVAAASVIGTNDVQATVTLTGPAPAGGLEIELSSSDPAVAAVPPVLTVPEGTISATVSITTSLVTGDTQVTIAAQHATTTKTAAISVLHPSGNYVSSLVVTPRFIVGGSSAGAVVTLAMPSAEHGGSFVILTSNNTTVSVPESVKVNPNDTTATFSIATTNVSSPVPVVVTASYGGVVQRAHIVVAPENAVTLASFAIVPNRVPGGSAAIGTVTLTGPAPLGGASVTVAAQRRNIVSVPNTVVVPEGAAATSFTIATDALHAAREKPVEIVATYNNVSSSAALTVLPAAQNSGTRMPVALCASLAAVPCLTQSTVRKVAPLGGRDGDPPPVTTTTLLESRYTLYSPELTLLAETTTSAGTPSIAYEYVWFGGQPLAQIENATGNIRWYFNDHLGTPLVLTDANARLVWQAEYEPYGTIYALRRGSDESLHQPLRLPGQTADDGSDLYQNVFRWYRAGWGRYTQADPVEGAFRSYSYADGNPAAMIDPLGLATLNYGGVTRAAVSGNDMYILTKSTGALGATFREGEVSCPCSPACSMANRAVVYKMNVTIDIVFHIWVLRGGGRAVPFGHWATEAEIFFEEMKHVIDYRNRLRNLLSDAETLEAFDYPSKAQCDVACSLFKRRVESQWSQSIQYVHQNQPHPGFFAGRGWQ